MPGRRAHAARMGQHLTRVDDVVDLVVLRAPARLDVERAALELVQPVGVHGAEVELAAAGRHQVDDGLGGAAGVRDPDAVGEPEAPDLRRRAGERVVVDGEREVPVERLGDAHLRERGQQLLRPAERLGPVLLGERPRRDLVAVGVPLELGRLDRDRRVSVGADAVALAALAEVHGAILMAQDGVIDAARAGQLGQRIGPREEVLHRLHRDQRQAERAHELRRPEAEAHEGRRRADRALVGLDRPHLAAGHVDAGRARAPDEGGAARLGGLLQRLTDVDASGDPVARHVQRAVEKLAVEQRDVPDRLVGCDDVALEPPRGRIGVAPPQLGQALGRGRHLERADLPPGAALRRVERAVELARPLRERAGELRAVGLETEPGRVERGAARVADRALVDDQDVAHAGQREVVRGRAADDPRAEHDDFGALLHALRRCARARVPGHPRRRRARSTGGRAARRRARRPCAAPASAAGRARRSAGRSGSSRRAARGSGRGRASARRCARTCAPGNR